MQEHWSFKGSDAANTWSLQGYVRFQRGYNSLVPFEDQEREEGWFDEADHNMWVVK